MLNTPYATRRQRVPSVQDEVLSNIAEYAAMNGIPFEVIHRHVHRHVVSYAQMLTEIHRTRGAA